MTSIGLGLRRRRHETTLDVWFIDIKWETSDAKWQSELEKIIGSPITAGQFIPCAPQNAVALASHFITTSRFTFPFDHPYSHTDIGVFALTDIHSPIQSVEEAYFKLHAISRRHALPHTLSLDGLFGTLPNIAWTSKGPVLPQDVDALRLQSWGSEYPLTVTHVDKFPYLVNYHIPTGVRIASGSQVRLGAYLGEGTTVMPSGYINFNAGTKGHAMVEGRVSAGVIVGEKSDVGGGASIMGTLSGGNSHVISIGAQCLLGANSGTGISLGTGCTIAAGLYIYAGLKIALLNQHNQPIDINGNPVQSGQNIVKASAVSGKDFLLFIQDSQSGQIICKPNQKMIELNPILHR
jgi:2,3,4,5-tetrahydropyridine-2-carboxylate N-succinyltransferase